MALLVNAQQVERSPHTDMQGLTLVLGLAEDDAQVASVLSWGSESLDAVNLNMMRQGIAVAVGMAKAHLRLHGADSGLDCNLGSDHSPSAGEETVRYTLHARGRLVGNNPPGSRRGPCSD